MHTPIIVWIEIWNMIMFPGGLDFKRHINAASDYFRNERFDVIMRIDELQINNAIRNGAEGFVVGQMNNIHPDQAET